MISKIPSFRALVLILSALSTPSGVAAANFYASAPASGESESNVPQEAGPALAFNPDVYGEWEQVTKSSYAGMTWTFTTRLSIQPGRVGLSLTCSSGGLTSGMAAVAVPAEITSTQVIPKYRASETVSYRPWVFGDAQTCNTNIDGVINYQFDGLHVTVEGGEPLRRVHRSGLSKMPFSAPEQAFPVIGI